YESGETGFEKTMNIGKNYITYSKDFPNYYAFISLFEGGYTNTDPIRSMENAHRCHDIMHRAIKTGIDDGTIRKDLHPGVLGNLLWSMSTGMIQLIKTRGDVLEKFNEIDENMIYQHFFNLISTALSTEKSSKELMPKLV
ncbi:MAG: hypothetical protein AAGI07_11970, partial [Bacteroidota bacterium]